MLHSILSQLSSQLAQLPGEQFPPSLSLDMVEWQVEFIIDYHLNNEEDESEDTYFLMLKLTCDNGALDGTFSLNHFVQDVGSKELADFPLGRTADWPMLLSKSADLHDLHKDALPAGLSFIEAIIPFIKELRRVA